MKHRSSCRRPAPVVLSRRSSGPTGFQEAPVVWGRRSAARSSFSLAALATVPREGPRTRATSTTRHLHRCRFPAPVARSRRFTHRLAASPSRSPIRRQRRRPPFHTAPDPAASPFEAGGAAPPQPPEHLNPFRRALLAGRGNDGGALPANDPLQGGAEGFPRLLCHHHHHPSHSSNIRIPSEVSQSPTQATPLHHMPCDHHPPLPAAPTCGRRTPKRSHPCPRNRRSTPSKPYRTARSPPRCGNGRDRGDRRAVSAVTTPRLKSQSGHLPQGPQSPILANYRGIATSWTFVAPST